MPETGFSKSRPIFRIKKMVCIGLGIGLLCSSCQTIDEQPAKLEVNSILALQGRMKTDPVFQLYEKSFRRNLQIALANRTTKQSLNKALFDEGIKTVKSRQEYYSLLERAGIKNAEEQMVAHEEFIKAEAALVNKYPQIKQMNRKEFDQLMSEANKVDGALMKNILRPSK